MTVRPTPPTDTPVQGPEQRASDAFVAYVLDLCANKRIQAELRTGLGRPVERCNYLHRRLVNRLPERSHGDARRAHYAVAALIAARPRAARDADAQAASEEPQREQPQSPAVEWRGRPNLGASLALAVNQHVVKPDSAEGDLHWMVRQSSTAIHPRLPALTRHLLTGGIPVDWAVLLEDLTWWDRSRDRIATRWLESYFRVLTVEDRRAAHNEEND
jgi:CRISPR system Cascade subunit CasB